MNNKKQPLDRRHFLTGLGAGATLAGANLLSGCVNSSSESAKCKPSTRQKPVSPYLIERETDDGGFSKGWLPHFSPSEEYWIDTHAHFRNITDQDSLNTLLDKWFSILDAYRLGRVVCISNQENMFEVFGTTAREDTRFAWMYWPKIDAPSFEKVREATGQGSCAIKMHNSPLIEGRVPRNIYEKKEWQDIFAYAEANDIPLLWHATSRVNRSPYHGGTRHWLWENGWKNGVKFTNEDLLQDMLAWMRRYPKLKIIGAHTLYLGIDRLTELFKTYENLYIDSSCSMVLRWADDFSEDVRNRLCDFIETWSERILFGSDASLFPGCVDEYAIQAFLAHARFMSKLWLNDKALQDVSWRTALRLLKLKPVVWSRRGSVRP